MENLKNSKTEYAVEEVIISQTQSKEETEMENENFDNESLEEVLEKIREATEPCTATKVAVFAGQTALVAGIAYAGYRLYDYFCSSE